MPKSLANIVIQATPNLPSHAARLKDVYDLIEKHFKDPVRAAAPGNLDGTYAALVLTASANGALTVDGIALAVGDRVLLPNQTDATQNGIYAVTAAGDAGSAWVLTRAADFDSSGEIFSGVKVHVYQGTSYGDTTFVLTSDDPITLDTTSLIWALDAGKLLMVKEKRFSIVGDDATLAFAFTHGWNTRAVTVDLVDAVTYDTVYADVRRTSDNAVTITFAEAPGTGDSYQAIVRAEVAN
jgi:hypothetical protein